MITVEQMSIDEFANKLEQGSIVSTSHFPSVQATVVRDSEGRATVLIQSDGTFLEVAA